MKKKSKSARIQTNLSRLPIKDMSQLAYALFTPAQPFEVVDLTDSDTDDSKKRKREMPDDQGGVGTDIDSLDIDRLRAFTKKQCRRLWLSIDQTKRLKEKMCDEEEKVERKMGELLDEIKDLNYDKYRLNEKLDEEKTAYVKLLESSKKNAELVELFQKKLADREDSLRGANADNKKKENQIISLSKANSELTTELKEQRETIAKDVDMRYGAVVASKECLIESHRERSEMLTKKVEKLTKENKKLKAMVDDYQDASDKDHRDEAYEEQIFKLQEEVQFLETEITNLRESKGCGNSKETGLALIE